MTTLNNTNLMTMVILTGVASLTLTNASFADRYNGRQSFRGQVQSCGAPVIYCQTTTYNNRDGRYIDSCRDDHEEKRWVKAVRLVCNAIIEAHRQPAQTIVYTQPLPRQTVIIKQPRPVEVTYVREQNRRPTQLNTRIQDKKVTIIRTNNPNVDKRVRTKNNRRH